MGTGNEATDDIRSICALSRERRYRLNHPPHPVADIGIDLNRNKVAHVQPDLTDPSWQAIPPPPPLPPPTPKEEIPSCWTGRLFTKRIIAITAQYFGITSDDIIGHRRGAKFVRPRQMACYLLREITHKSFPTIGGILGSRDHTTTLYSYRKIERQIREKIDIHTHYSNIMALIDAELASNPRPPVPSVTQPVVAVELENQKSLPQPEIYFMAEASGTAMVDTKTAKFSNYYWPIYGDDYTSRSRQETPRPRQPPEMCFGFLAGLADYRERQILAGSSTALGSSL